MKFVPRSMGEATENSSGGGRRGMWIEIRKLALLTVVTLLVVWGGFHLLALAAVRVITPEQEAALLAELLPELDLWQPESEADQARLAAVQEIFQRLIALPEVPNLNYRLVVLDDPDPNAFAFPGGTVGLTRGLLESLEDQEIAYAFVLGHELGHFKNRDHLRGIIRNLGAGATLQILFGSSSMSGTIRSGGQFMELGYSRSQEIAADDFGILLLRQLYDDPSGAALFFEKILEEESPPSWAYMFLTHPDPRERIRRLQRGLEH